MCCRGIRGADDLRVAGHSMVAAPDIPKGTAEPGESADNWGVLWTESSEEGGGADRDMTGEEPSLGSLLYSGRRYLV